MTETPEGTVTVEESDETNYFVVDPDDYQKTKKLESIHKIKQEILKVRSNRMELIQDYHDDFHSRHNNTQGRDVYEHRLAQTVAQYGSELLPLIEEGLQKGTIDKDDLVVKLSPQHTECDLRFFIEMDGRIRHDSDVETAPETNAMAIYRQLERIERTLGLGLDLEEEKGPAQI